MRLPVRVVSALGGLVAALVAAGSSGTTAAAARPAHDHGSTAGSARPAVEEPALPVRASGRWMVDRRGRVVLVHGINVSLKGAFAQSRAMKFGADDASFLARNGINAVRLTVERYDIEPAPGRFDRRYLRYLRHVIDLLDRQGIVTMVDFHQDEFGPVFGDNGYPAWMTMTAGLPNLKSVGFPLQYLLNPAVNHAFDSLWSNAHDSRGRPLWEDDAQILGTAARVLRSARGVLGYEILNEPWPGTVYPTCLPFVIGCPTFDRTVLSRYYARMAAALRRHDPTRMVWYEPLVTFNYGIPTSVKPPARDVGFAFHDYPLCSAADDIGLPISLDTDCGVESGLTISNALHYARSHRVALLDTEFGATTKPAAITEAVAAYDRSMVPWMFWSYAELAGTDSSGAFNPDPSRQANHGVLTALARPYPQLVSGTPLNYSYNPATHAFTLRYTTNRASGSGRFAAGSRTLIAVPPPAYPSGYRVQVSGGRVAGAAHAPLLRIAARSHADVVTVSIRPG